METVDPKTHLDALVAAVGPARVERLRAASMSRAEAERQLALLVIAAAGTRVDPTAPTLSVAQPRPPRPAPPAEPPAEPHSEHPSTMASAAPSALAPSTSRSTAETVMPALGRVLGDPSGSRRRLDGLVDDEPDAPSGDDALADLESPDGAAALLRPPSRPAPPADPPEAPTATRAAMDALFDDSDPGLMVFSDAPSDSAPGLVVFGDAMDEAAERFVASRGTDPDVAPLPAESAEDTAGEAVLAGAEAPLTAGDDEVPFGFGFGDAEPTVAERRPSLDDEQAQRARRDETLLSSVRKLFGR